MTSVTETMAAKRVMAAVVEMAVEVALETGRVPSAELVDECMREYRAAVEAMREAYCDDAEMREDVQRYVLAETYRRIRERHGLAA